MKVGSVAVVEVLMKCRVMDHKQCLLVYDSAEDRDLCGPTLAVTRTEVGMDPENGALACSQSSPNPSNLFFAAGMMS